MGVVKWIGGFSGATTDVNQTGNYNTSALPIAGDDLYVEGPTGPTFSMAVNLAALVAIKLNSLNISQTYTGQIGTPAAYLQIGATTANIGYQYGGAATSQGSQMLRWDAGSNQTMVNITNTAASSALTNSGPLCILASHSANTLNVVSGIITIAVNPGETTNFQTINNAGGKLYMGSGLTHGTLNLSGGATSVRAAVTSLNSFGGALTTSGTGAITTLNIYSGTASLNSTGTITNLKVFAGTADFSGDLQAKTVINCTTFSAAATVNINTGVKNSVTITNGVTSQGAQGKVITVPGNTISVS